MNTSIVDEIKDRCNIVDVVSRYVTLKRSGSNHMGLCPFHNEKTPSFAVSENKQFFNCFGCGESGDVITFLMKIENIDFHTAISKLAESYGIDMDKFGFKNESRKAKFYELNREAAMFFFRNMTEKVNPGFEYMKKRGVDPKTIARFGIGYAEDSWGSLLQHLKEKNYSEEMMYEAGLISKSHEKQHYFDKFRNRVIFPIFNTGGKVIGFGGRDLGSDGPKYLNSPESAIFSKKNNLYGLNLTRQDINNNNCAIIVEGYMDLVSLYKNGITNVAASLGTALTENQCRLLKRYTENVVVSYDADEAGQKAALRGIELLHKAGLKARVLHISDGKDPDDFVRKNGRLEFLKLVDEALPYVDYKIMSVKKKYDLSSAEQSIDFLKEIKIIFSDLSPVEADVYIRKLAADTGISEGAIRREINTQDDAGEAGASLQIHNINVGAGAPDTGIVGSGNVMLQKHFIKLLSVNPDYLGEIRKYESVFVEPVYYRIYRAIENIIAEDNDIDTRRVADLLEPDDAHVYQNILETVLFPSNSERVLEECIRTVRLEKLTRRQSEILQILDLMPENDTAKIDSLTKELMSIQAKMQKIRE